MRAFKIVDRRTGLFVDVERVWTDRGRLFSKLSLARCLADPWFYPEDVDVIEVNVTETVLMTFEDAVDLCRDLVMAASYELVEEYEPLAKAS